MHFSNTIAIVGLATLAQGSRLQSRSLSGQATFYGGNVAGGACSFSTYTLPSSIYGTALSDSNWDTAANCGACVSVTGPSGNSITAMIVDECPGCGTNHLDLFPDAFTQLAAQSVGVIDVTWDYVDCPITSALQLVNKAGVSAYWFSMQVVNANQRVESLEVSTDGGSTWQSTTRTDYNFFEASSGFGTTTVDIKVTSVNGDVVTVDSVTVSSGTSVTASSNFGSSSSSGSKLAAASSSVIASSSSVAPVESASSAAAAVATSAAVMTSDTPASSTTAAAAGIFIESFSTVSTTSSAIVATPSSTSVAPVVVAAPSTASSAATVAETSAVSAAATSSATFPGLVGIQSSATTLVPVVASAPTSAVQSIITAYNCSISTSIPFPVYTTTVYKTC